MAEGVESALAAAEKLTLALDEIDDKEFDLPIVENPPTLESILNEPDNEDDSIFGDDQVPSDQMFQGDQGDTSSMSSQEGILSDRPKRKHKKSVRYAEHGSILRHVILKQVSAQLMSAADRVDAGMPTAMAVAGLVAVGTSHGLVLIFDPKQVLKWCLGSTAVGAQYGAVSALSFNRDNTRLLCGFAKGQITMWDLTTGKLLRTITDAHPPGTAILHVKFTDDLTLAVCSDSGGSVFELEFKRLIGVRTCESRCLFSGSRGEVCTVEPLHMNYTIKDHPMKSVILLAMASLSKVLIVTMKPQLKVLFTFPLKGDSGTLPLLSWQFVIIQVSESDRVIDPVLAFARDQTIHFFQVVCTDPENIKIAPLQKTELPYKLLSLTWMNSRTLVVIDTSERIHILDVRSEEELEVIDIGDVQLTYSSSFYKSLATGGNVSKALAYAGERACYQSVVSFGGQILMLGTKSLHVMTTRSWEERIDVLAKQGKYQEALYLAQSFYEGRAKAVVGLLGGSQKRKDLVAEKMLQSLDEFVDASMTRNCPGRGKIEVLEEYYQTVVPVCVDYCLTLNRVDILFGKLYERFGSDPIAHGTFLECLEPYILSDRLTSITPFVMKDFINHYEVQELLENVEACIVHLDIASLDIHQVVVLCWTHGLYDAILYIYNKGMLDYTTPLEELLRLLRSAVMTGKQFSDDQIRLGNKLLVYVSCCLAGRAYPLGDIPASVVEKVKDDVFVCVTCLHTKEADKDEPVYPHLKTLLQFDTREFFNVLALAFEEPEFSTPEGIEKRQRIVDILLQIMVESVGFSPTQVGILFTFLARQMARHENTIMVNRLLFEQVLEFLSRPGDDSHHEERQQALMELLTAGGLLQFDEQRLLTLAENAKFYRVCEFLYQQRREFDKILSCYWRDPFRRHQAFTYIQNIMTAEEFTFEEKVKVQKEALSHIQELISIDSKKTAQLVLLNFMNSLHEIITVLNATPAVCYEFLQGLFECRDSNGSAIYAERQVNIEPQIQEHYIELMCQFQPAAVYAYIKMAEGYRLEETLEICRKYKVSDATAFILEKAGDVEGAFNIYLQNLQEKVKDVILLLSNNSEDSGTEKDLTIAWSSVQTVLLVLIQLNQRNSGKMEETDREALWFPLLEAMMSPQRKLKDSVDKKYLEAFKELTRHVLNSMMGYISLPAILQKIMQDPSYNTGKFGEIKELLLGMLDTYNYEKTLLHTCNQLLNQDLHHQMVSLTWAAMRGYTARQEQCDLCHKHFVMLTEKDSVVVFRCGHGFHLSCLKAIGAGQMIDGEMHWACHLCSSAKRGRLQSTRMQRLPSHPGHEHSDQNGKKSAKPVLDEMQVHSIDNLRKVQKIQSRLGILTELAKRDNQTRTPSNGRTNSFLQNDRFRLNLAPPPPFDL